jgi:1,4-dihydroxy-2-naphthoate octaprenyltransferase
LSGIPIAYWIKAARLRTLPLAFSCILLGSFLAAAAGSFDPWILVLSLLTTLFFQVLSNYANDLGDGVKGTDEHRKGEQRMVGSGLIPMEKMKRAVYLFVLLSFVSACLLSQRALAEKGWIWVALFIALGALAILSAVFYTVGDAAYGYRGLGDLFVLLFFGWVGVVGSYFLQMAVLDWSVFLPASSVGLLSVGVLNLNNMRDIETDRAAGKKSIPVRIGLPYAKIYHMGLLLFAFNLSFLYVLGHGGNAWRNLYWLSVPLILWNLWSVSKSWQAEEFDPLLKRLALTTLLFSLSLGCGILLSVQ